MADFFKQLWARKVVQFGAIYLGAAWVLFQVAIAVESTLELPGWVDQVTLVALGLGFPVALILAWAQESRIGTLLDGVMPVVSSQGDKKGLARIAVLPFLNMSGDEDKEYFADGMTEDIITGIARNPHISVTSRTSAFAYKGQAVDVREAGKALGVDYVLEGSVRPMGDRIRITAQLIDAASGDHLWAEKYDEPTAQLFEVQDEVIAAITQALGVQLIRAELNKSRGNAKDLNRWQFIHKQNVFLTIGVEDNIRLKNVEGPQNMQALLEKEPDFAPAHVVSAWHHAALITNGWTKDAATDGEARDRHLARGLTLGPNDPIVLMYAGGINIYAGRFEEGIAQLERALDLDPNMAEAHLHLTMGYGAQLRFEDAMAEFAKARAGGLMATHAPWLYWYEALVRLINLDFDQFSPLQMQAMTKMPGMDLPLLLQKATGALASMTTPGIKEIEASLRQAVALMPGYELPAVLLAATYALMARRDDALKMRAHAMKINPDFKLENLDFLFSLAPDQRGIENTRGALQALWAIEV
ncbi:MAG: hypothetical protein ACPG1C_10675 [Alphaproteobacteria bacterium]